MLRYFWPLIYTNAHLIEILYLVQGQWTTVAYVHYVQNKHIPESWVKNWIRSVHTVWSLFPDNSAEHNVWGTVHISVLQVCVIFISQYSTVLNPKWQIQYIQYLQFWYTWLSIVQFPDTHCARTFCHFFPCIPYIRTHMKRVRVGFTYSRYMQRYACAYCTYMHTYVYMHRYSTYSIRLGRAIRTRYAYLGCIHRDA